MSSTYAEVLLPLPLPGTFSYKVTEELKPVLVAGMRVVVQFGNKKLYSAIIRSLHDNPPPFPAKEIISLIDFHPVVLNKQFQLWDWISSYYMCYPGEVMGVAMPSALKLNSETRISFADNESETQHNLSEKEFLVCTALRRHKTMDISEVSKITGQTNPISLVKSLIDKGLVVAFEDIEDKYKPKTEKYYQLSEVYRNNAVALSAMLDYLEKRAPKQSEVLQAVLYLLSSSSATAYGIARPFILETLTNAEAPLSALVEKGIITETEQVISRLTHYSASEKPSDIELSPDQLKAFQQILDGFEMQKPVLLHGVTSSGKTEIYIKLIDQTIRQGKQVLYLLPEIALTTQIIDRLRHYFGDKVGVYHSRLNDAERVEIWEQVLKHALVTNETASDTYRVILGARSALFLPFHNLGLIIIDEEHDSSFKQQDPPPRYHARDTALVLARLHKANCLLGTATPSIESYFNARTGKYFLVELNRRFGNVELPQVELIDMDIATKEHIVQGHLSHRLLDAIQKAISAGNQVILLQNRRGYSLMMECPKCHWIPGCRHCDVTLIYHKREKHLRCHYCGYHEPVPSRCDLCLHPEIKLVGFGTERIEEDLITAFPRARIARMDLDTTRSRFAYQRIIHAFEKGEIDILIGTQMISKGLDFDNVSLVGVLNADQMINYPDFRSFERSFQLLTQVAGRAGRKDKQGSVIIQTRNPQHPVIQFVINNDYTGMYEMQVGERRKFLYPPFSRLIIISLKHKDSEALDKAAEVFAALIRQHFPTQVLGPEYPLVSRIRNYFIKDVLIKIKRNDNLAGMKQLINETITGFLRSAAHKHVRIAVDVDPY